MNSNHHPSAYGYRPATWSPLPPKPHVNEDTLKSGLVQIERKTFVFTLKENIRGRLLRITEDLGGRRTSIIVPSTGLEEFKNLLEEMVQAANELPPEKNPLD
jgi:PurA ssDNA and RNA-binding protein